MSRIGSRFIGVCRIKIINQASRLDFQCCNLLNNGSSAVLMLTSNILAIRHEPIKMMSVDPVYILDFST